MLRFRVALPVLIVGILMCGWLSGQDKDPPPKGKGKLPQNWSKLGLSDEQKQSIYRILARYGEKIDDLKAKQKDLEREEKSELLKILTPAQIEKLKDIAVGDPKGKDKDKPSDKDKDKPKDK